MAERWQARAVVLVVAGTIALGVAPGAGATDHLPRFTGRCGAAGPASLYQVGKGSQGMYFDLPVSCTGTMDGARVSGKRMRFYISGWPAVVNCGSTSVAHGGTLLTEPTGGGAAMVGNGVGAMLINNKTRTVSFVGDHITTKPLGVGTIRATFKFSPPPTNACGRQVHATVSATGSMVAT